MKRTQALRPNTLEVNTINIRDGNVGFNIDASVYGIDQGITLKSGESNPITLKTAASNSASVYIDSQVINLSTPQAGGYTYIVNGLALGGISKSSNYSPTGFSEILILCDASTKGFTINLPDVSGLPANLLLHFKKTDSSSNQVVIKAFSGTTIEGNIVEYLTTQYQGLTIYADVVVSVAIWYKLNNTSVLTGTTTSTSTTSTSTTSTSSSTTSTSTSTSTTSTSTSTSTTSTSSSTSTSTTTTA